MINNLFEYIINIYRKRLVGVLFIGGIILIILGEFLAAQNFSLSLFFFTIQPGKILSNIGIAIIGTGFFTAVTKSVYYTTFFQERVYDVFFSPSKHLTADSLKHKWSTITCNLLETTTGDLNGDISNELLSRYFDKESPYHLEDQVSTYDIELDRENNKLKIKQNISCYVIINKNHQEAEIVHKWLCSGSLILESLFINNVPQDHTDMVEFFDYDGDATRDKFAKFTIKLHNNEQKPILVERSYYFEQDFIEDPWLIVNNSKYIKNFLIKYRAKNCKVSIEQTGIINSPEHKPMKTQDPEGYTRVILGKQDQLTLPGQGYILIMTPIKQQDGDIK